MNGHHEVRRAGRGPSRRWVKVGISLVVLACVGSAVATAQLRVASPTAQLAASAAPPATRLTAPVEQGLLEERMVLRGRVAERDNREIQLLGSTADAAVPIVTRAPSAGAVLNEGDSLLEISGRPVVVLVGVSPMYRDINPGDTGTDVAQIDQALNRLGLLASPNDTWEQESALAFAQLQTGHGYDANARLSAQRERLDQFDEELFGASLTLESATSSAAAGEARLGVDTQIRDSSRTATQAEVASRQLLESTQLDLDSLGVSEQRLIEELGRAQQRLNRLVLTPEAPAAGSGDPLEEARTAVRVANEQLQDAAQQRSKLLLTVSQQLELQASAAATAREGGQTAAQHGAFAEANRQLSIDQQRAVLDRIEERKNKFVRDLLWTVPVNSVVFIQESPTVVRQAKVEIGSELSGVVASVSSGEVSFEADLPAGVDTLPVGSGAEIVADATGERVNATVGQMLESDTGSTEAAADGAPTESAQTARAVAHAAPRVQLDLAATGASGLALGDTFAVRVLVRRSSTAELVVPERALNLEVSGASAVTVRNGSTERVVAVEVLATAGGKASIRPTEGGLEAGDRVVLK